MTESKTYVSGVLRGMFSCQLRSRLGLCHGLPEHRHGQAMLRAPLGLQAPVVVGKRAEKHRLDARIGLVRP